jgi:hypothetical protein
VPAVAALAVVPALPGGGFADLFTNRVFLAGFWAWFCAQTLKVRGGPLLKNTQQQHRIPALNFRLHTNVGASLCCQQLVPLTVLAVNVWHFRLTQQCRVDCM